MKSDLKKQLAFIIEIDKLKHVYRHSYLMDGSRHENAAEHSWHLGILALLLKDYANSKVDVSRVVKMALIHDLVEIDAGDTYLFAKDRDSEAKRKLEHKAAQRIFNLLPAKQAKEFKQLFAEFDAGRTKESQFALAIDRLHPMLHNYATKGKSWRKNKVTSAIVLERTKSMAAGSKKLWQYAERLIRDAVRKGYLAK